MITLTDQDIEAIAERLLRELGRRLASSGAPPVVTTSPPPPPLTPVKLPTPKLAYTLKELSEELGVSNATMYRLTTRGLLKPLPYLRTKVFTRAEVERFLREGMDWQSDGRRRRKRP